MVDKSKNPEFWAAQEKWSAWQKEQLENIEKERTNNIEITQLKITPPKDDFYGDCDHPNTMENSTATVLYILVMIGSLIFKDFLLIWVVASFIYFRFITRHKR